MRKIALVLAGLTCADSWRLQPSSRSLASSAHAEGSKHLKVLDDQTWKLSRAEVLRGAAAAAIAAVSSRPLAADALINLPANATNDLLVLYDTQTKRFLSARTQALLEALKRQRSGMPRVFFAGEEHPNPLHHTFQLSLIKAIDELDDAPTLIGLEMVTRQDQNALDTFIFGEESAGGGSIDLLAQRVDWQKKWGYPIELYAKIFEYARVRGIRLVGLNLPFEIIAKVGKGGLASLDAATRRTLPEVDLGDYKHWRRFRDNLYALIEAALIGCIPTRQLDRQYQAQALWDDYMASSLANIMSTQPREGAGVFGSKNTGKERIVVLSGSGHVQGRVGIPDRFTKRTELKTFTIVPCSVPWPTPGTWRSPQFGELLAASEADWVLYNPPFEEADA